MISGILGWLFGLLAPVAITLLVAFLTPVVAFIAHRWVDAGRRRRAYERLLHEPLTQVGAHIDELHMAGRDTPLMTNCYVYSLEVGRVEIRDSAGRAVSFTGREMEGLFPVTVPGRTVFHVEQPPNHPNQPGGGA